MPLRLVLLHSPLLGPLSWRAVVEALGARGRLAEAPAWPGLLEVAGDFYPALAEGLARTIDAGGAAPAILVAHSGAGALVPSIVAAAETPVAGVIFADAILPHPGKSWFETAPAALSVQLRGGAQQGLLPAWDAWWPPGALERLIPDETLRAALTDELEPLPAAYFEETAPELGLGAPCAYLRLSGAYEEEARQAVRRGWPVVRLPLHHLAMLTQAQAVANGLETLAAALEAKDG